MSEGFSGITGSDGGRGRTWVGGGKRRFGEVLERGKRGKNFHDAFLESSRQLVTYWGYFCHLSITYLGIFMAKHLIPR